MHPAQRFLWALLIYGIVIALCLLHLPGVPRT